MSPCLSVSCLSVPCPMSTHTHLEMQRPELPVSPRQVEPGVPGRLDNQDVVVHVFALVKVNRLFGVDDLHGPMAVAVPHITLVLSLPAGGVTGVKKKKKKKKKEKTNKQTNRRSLVFPKPSNPTTGFSPAT